MSACARAVPRRIDRFRVGLLAAVVLLAAAWPAAAQEVTYTGSAQVATGDYIFTQPTTSFYLLNSLEVAKGSVRIAGSIPFVLQSTPWITYAPVPLTTGGSESAQVADQIRQKRQGQTGAGRTGSSQFVTLPTAGLTYASGFADPVVQGDVELLRGRPGSSLRAGGALKFPLADPAGGFGTGEWDYGFSLSGARAFGRNGLSGSLAYWHLGDLPDLNLNDALAYAIGYQRQISARWSVLGSLAGWTTIIDGVSPPIDLGFGITRHFGMSGRSISVIATVGLTAAAPGFSVALGWRLPVFQRSAMP